MSTDSTELTFVRCPACRSLVPAVSTRCRMCGATLDASAKVDQSEEERKRTSRVRQRTMSQPQSELADAAGQIRQEMSDPPVAEAEKDPFDIFDEPETAAPEEAAVGDDPLGQYISEIDELEGHAEVAAKEAIPTIDITEVEEAPEIMESAAPVQPAPAARQEASPAPRDRDNRSFQREEKREERRDERRDDRREERREEKRDEKPKVMVESGARPSGKPSNLSFGKGREEKPAERERAPERGGDSGNDRRQQGRNNDNERFSKPANKPEQSARPEQEQNKQNKQEKPAMLNKPAAQQHESKKTFQAQTGRLYGWLVNYEDPQGSAIELREGRFFISGSNLKENDLVIQGKGLSTPHAMVTVSASNGFKIQDLMSETGLLVRKKNQGSFQREEGTANLEHGDWVKLGDAEYLVAVIDFQR